MRIKCPCGARPDTSQADPKDPSIRTCLVCRKQYELVNPPKPSSSSGKKAHPRKRKR